MDDSQVSRISARRFEDKHRPRVEIEVTSPEVVTDDDDRTHYPLLHAEGMTIARTPDGIGYVVGWREWCERHRARLDAHERRHGPSVWTMAAPGPFPDDVEGLLAGLPNGN